MSKVFHAARNALRLAETEAALYSALVTLQGNMPDTVVQAVAKADEQKTKSTRMEEWSKLPLRDWPDMGNWMGAVSDQFTINQVPSSVSVAPGPVAGIQITPSHRRAPSSTDLELHGISTPFAWQPQDDHSIRSPYAGHIRSQDAGSSPAYSHHTVPGGTDGVAPSLIDISSEHLVGVTSSEPVRAKADELSRVRSSIYF
ncbi:uncharacterized protein N7483_009808 [Penicillium malachiteum]|uniref:uncharacterized protein n=1 Tax=Penicillium malachiteum TaxID=1324776 RepID=UPI0025478312|nr:uncharacterized protein N7483_009808 [Penicillium malachiteum]KAJ5721874.1 hypothetical protein N7483_009808 [Penicillium malachiteum]